MENPAVALVPVVVILAGGIAAILASRIARVSSIVGFLVFGIVVGQHGLGVLEVSETTQLLAELGVVFLLFDIGLHFSLREVRETRRDLITLAPAQMVLCTFAFALVGMGLGLDWPIAVILGVAFSLSSTAVVARLLAERNLATCPLGRSVTAVLVFQDIAAIFLLVFAHSLGQDGADAGAAAAMAAVKAVLALVAALTAGRFLAAPAFALLARTRNEEAFPAAVLFVVLATATATGALGLSLTLGAFLAGMIVAETPYRHVVQTEVRPFRSLLMGFFFITVGMMLDTAALLQMWWAVLALAAGLMALKSALVFLSARISGWTDHGALQLAGLLSQGSEFALVIFGIAVVAAGLPPGAEAVLVGGIAVTLALTPPWSLLHMRFARTIAARKRAAEAGKAGDAAKQIPAPAAGAAADGAPVVVFGLTESGRLAVDALRALNVPVIAVDNDADRHAAAMADGYEAVFGDTGDTRLLSVIGADRARAVVIGAPRYHTSHAMTPWMREQYPTLDRFVAVDTPQEADQHKDLGMRAFVIEERPHGIEMVEALLASLKVDAEAAATWARNARGAFLELPDEDETHPAAA